MGLVGFILLLAGIFSAASPYHSWYLSYGWRFKDAEPSDAALVLQRISGVIAVIVGLILLISSCSSGSADSHWIRDFKDKLAAEEVQEIKVGFINPVTLNKEDTETVIRLLQEATLEPFEAGNSFGYNNSGEIIFKDGSPVTIIIGTSGSTELHPTSTDSEFRVNSSSLESWFRTHFPN